MAHGALDEALSEIDQLGAVLPDGNSVLAAAYVAGGEAVDLFVRDPDGQTSVALGMGKDALADVERLIAIAHGESPAVVAVAEPSPRATATSLYRTIVEECPIPLAIVGRSGVIEYASPAVAVEFECDSPTQLVGRSWTEFIHPGDLQRIMTLLRLPPRELSGRSIVARFKRPDGGVFRVEAVARPLTDPDGGLAAAVVAFREARETRGDERAVSERSQRALSDAADCGTALLAMRDELFGTVVEANRPFGEMIGGSGLTAGVSVADLVCPADAVRCSEALRAVAETGVPRRLEVRLAANPDRQVEMVIALDRSSGDPPTRMTARVRDVTAQRGYIAELRRVVDRLEQTNRELAEFARVTAHDLAAPLRAVSGLLDLVSPSVDPEVTDTLGAIRSAIARMQAMVDAVVGYAQTENADSPRLPVDLSQTLDDALDVLRTEIAESGAVIAAEELPTLLGDRPQFERLLLNLLGNAIKYAGPSAPRIRVAAVREPDRWVMSVADQGVGVPEGDRLRIFELFERGTVGRPMRRGTGRGIGLATCRRIVERHGGRIWVTPNEPTGAIFHFTCPDDIATGRA